jgi:hypothetical protein
MSVRPCFAECERRSYEANAAAIPSTIVPFRYRLAKLRLLPQKAPNSGATSEGAQFPSHPPFHREI